MEKDNHDAGNMNRKMFTDSMQIKAVPSNHQAFAFTAFEANYHQKKILKTIVQIEICLILAQRFNLRTKNGESPTYLTYQK